MSNREPEILDEAAIADDERAVDRPVVDVRQIPRMIGGLSQTSARSRRGWRCSPSRSSA